VHSTTVPAVFGVQSLSSSPSFSRVKVPSGASMVIVAVTGRERLGEDDLRRGERQLVADGDRRVVLDEGLFDLGGLGGGRRRERAHAEGGRSRDGQQALSSVLRV
jgi:hypothetical protein